eukprot:COSAG03_NODE_16716_length_394_cov_0.654237_1_plen_64_part_10
MHRRNHQTTDPRALDTCGHDHLVHAVEICAATHLARICLALDVAATFVFRSPKLPERVTTETGV